MRQTDKRFRGCWPLTKYKHNNAVGFIHSTIEGLASSVWGDTVLTLTGLGLSPGLS